MATTKPIEIKFKKLTEDAMPPSKHDGDAAFDLYAAEDTVIPAGRSGVEVPTGIAVQMPQGYYMEIFMRSSYGKNTALRLSNCVGVIDNLYRGEIKGLFDNHGKDVLIHKGERFAQAIIKQEIPTVFIETKRLTTTQRGAGGFGSTGK